MNAITVGGRRISPDYPSYIIAEVSANHHQSFDRAVEIIHAAAAAGADAIKIQTYTASTLTLNSDQPWFRIDAGSPWAGRTLHDLYSEAYTPWEWHEGLQKAAVARGLAFFSSPFDSTAVDFLEQLGVPAYKIASFEIVDCALLKRVAQTGKPVIVSTGMATLSEVDEAVRTLREAGCQEIALLKCTSAYPAHHDQMNLRTIPHLAQTFGVPSGLSDHTLGFGTAVAAVSLGAAIVEKHITLRRADQGPDSDFSMEPDEFSVMVQNIRQAEQALGTVSYDRSPDEVQNLRFRRSLFAVNDIRRGELLTAVNVRSIRPGYGLHTRYLDQILGRAAAADIARGTPLRWEHIA